MPRNNPHIIGEFIFIRGGITNLREKCEIKSAWSTDIPAEKDKLDSPPLEILFQMDYGYKYEKQNYKPLEEK